MAIGDDALAAGMDLVSGTDDRRNGWEEDNKTRDYIAQRTATVTPVDKGGTGATTPAGARSNLGIPEWSAVLANDTLIRRSAEGRADIADPVFQNNITNKRYVDTKLDLTGGTVTGNVYFPNATIAASGYTVAYLNHDGRLSRGASSERYKKHIRQIDPLTLGDLFPALHRFQMRSGDGSWKYGWIAERLAEHPDQAPFVVHRDVDGEMVPDSIDFIALLIAQNTVLHQAVQLLTDRLDRLEE